MVSSSQRTETTNMAAVTSRAKKGWFLGVADTNDVIQKIEKTLNNTHTTTQKLTNNSFRNTKKHPKKAIGQLTTPENTITYHNALFLSPQNFAQALFSVSLGTILTPKRNQKQCLCKILG